MEQKFIDVIAEVKAVSANENIGVFEGYGSVFGNKDSYGDIVVKGAFIESLKKNGLPSLLWQHDPRNPIGVYTEAKEDERGLYLKGEINLSVQQGREAYELIKQGAIKGMSIGFYTEKEEEDRQNNIRYLKQLNLLEVSLVTFPANKLARVANWKGDKPKTEREFEDLLRQIGYGRRESTAIASGGFKAYLAMQRDSDADKVQREADYGPLGQSLNNLLIALKERQNG